MKTIEETRRELFEEWTKREHGNLSRRKDGDYFDDLTHGAWLGFNAALDAVEIELPTDPNHEFSDRASAVEACRSSITSTNLGLTVK